MYDNILRQQIKLRR